MQCFAALRQWELQTPDPTNDAAEFGNSAEQGGSKRPYVKRHPQQNERKLNLQTLEASPLSNRRSERPAEKPPTYDKHSEGVPHLLQYDALLLAERFCFCQHFEKTRAEKRKGLILRFSVLLLILQGYGLCIGHYKMLYLK